MEIVDSKSMVETWCGRISFIVSCLVVILFSGNYLNILDTLHIKNIKNIVVRIILIAVIDFLAVFVVVILSQAIQSFF